MSRTEVRDFDKDVPADECVDGLGAFLEKGRVMLFIEMIEAAAKDLCEPEKSELHQDSMRWLSDPANMAGFCTMIDATPEHAPTICKAILARPREIAAACTQALKSGSSSGTEFPMFMHFMGMKDSRGASSLYMEVADEFEAMTPLI